jgi:hypothetical protein
MSHDILLTRIDALRNQGLGGERFEDALDALLAPSLSALDTIDRLRMLYVENSDANKALVRWALAELDAEVAELEAVGVAA